MEERSKSIETIVADENAIGKRLDAWLATQLVDVTRTKIQKLIADGQILVDGKQCQAKEKVAIGATISINMPPPPRSELTPHKLDLDIIFEDEHLVVINKPAGLVVHPGAGDTGVTLAEGLLYHFGKMATGTGKDAWLRPGIVHRLDKDTTGAMVCAKTEKALVKLSKQFQDKTNQREYWAIVNGVMDSPLIERESYLHRDPNSRLKFRSLEVDVFEERYPPSVEKPPGLKWAKSLFKNEAVFADRISLICVKLFTGRTHQIRVHSADLKMTVLGDQLYSRPIKLPNDFGDDIINTVLSLKRQMLHGRLLGFNHPETNEPMQFIADLPSDFEELLNKLQPFARKN